jgi:hypothetical protein
VESTAAAMKSTAPAAMESTAPAAMESAASAAMATRRERRLRCADQNNRRNQNTKNSQQLGFFHRTSFAPPHV